DHGGDEFDGPGCFTRSRPGRAAVERGPGQVSEFDFRTLQSGVIAEVPPSIPGEHAVFATLSRAQPKLPSSAGPDRKHPHENRTTAEGVGTNPSNHPCGDPQ